MELIIPRSQSPTVLLLGGPEPSPSIHHRDHRETPSPHDDHDDLCERDHLRQLSRTPETHLREMHQTPQHQLKEMSQTPESHLREMSHTPESHLREMSHSPESHLREISHSPESHLREMSHSPESHLREISQAPEYHIREIPPTPEDQIREITQTPEDHIRETSQSPTADHAREMSQSPTEDHIREMTPKDHDIQEMQPHSVHRDITSYHDTSSGYHDTSVHGMTSGDDENHDELSRHSEEVGVLTDEVCLERNKAYDENNGALTGKEAEETTEAPAAENLGFSESEDVVAKETEENGTQSDSEELPVIYFFDISTL